MQLKQLLTLAMAATLAPIAGATHITQRSSLTLEGAAQTTLTIGAA